MKNIKKNERSAFSDSPDYIKKLVFENPPAWEYLLTIELLKIEIEAAKKAYWEIKADLIFGTLPVFDYQILYISLFSINFLLRQF